MAGDGGYFDEDGYLFIMVSASKIHPCYRILHVHANIGKADSLALPVLWGNGSIMHLVPESIIARVACEPSWMLVDHVLASGA